MTCYLGTIYTEYTLKMYHFKTHFANVLWIHECTLKTGWVMVLSFPHASWALFCVFYEPYPAPRPLLGQCKWPAQSRGNTSQTGRELSLSISTWQAASFRTANNNSIPLALWCQLLRDKSKVCNWLTRLCALVLKLECALVLKLDRCCPACCLTNSPRMNGKRGS